MVAPSLSGTRGDCLVRSRDHAACLPCLWPSLPSAWACASSAWETLPSLLASATWMRDQRLSPTSAWVKKPSEFLSDFLKRSSACCLRSASVFLPPCSPEHCGRAPSVLGASASASALSEAESANTEIARPTRVLNLLIVSPC